MNRDAYLERARAEVEKARARSPRYAGSCSDCKWSRFGAVWRHCAHPAVVCASFNIDDGYDKKAITRCEEQRDKSSPYGPVLCGPDGALFEASASASWLQRIFGGSA